MNLNLTETATGQAVASRLRSSLPENQKRATAPKRQRGKPENKMSNGEPEERETGGLLLDQALFGG